MAGYTVWILRMMFGDESGIVVADNALAAIKADALFGRWRAMWIVTGGAGEAIPAFLLAFAFQQRFPLAGGATCRAGLIFMHEIRNVIKEIITRAI